MLTIPCGKNYFVFIKTGKTAGSSMVEYLSKYLEIVWFKDLRRKRKKQLFNKLIIVTMDQVLFFQDEFPDIYEDSFTFGIVRNPYDRFVSGYLFHPFCRDFSMTEILSKLPTPPILPKYVRWKEDYPKKMWELFSAYNHISQPQSDPLINDLRFPINKLLKFEKIEGEVLRLTEDLSIGNPSQFPHIKKNTNRSHYSKYFNKDSVKLINKYFRSDFLFFDYEFL